MPEPASIRVSIKDSIASVDEQTLRTLLSTEVDIHDAPERAIHIDWHSFVAIARDAGIVANSVAAFVKIGNLIIEWRRRARLEGREVPVTLDRAGKRPLNLAEAEDPDISKWFER